jgi:hypothetical protein
MKTHWKKLQNPDYFGAWSLDGKDLDVTIEKVVLEQVTGTDGKKEELPVAYLKGLKPLILNTTNSKMIAKVTGSSYIEDWSGKRVTLYSTKVKAFGDTVDAVRVRSTAPKAAAIDYDKIIDAIRGGKATIEQAVDKYPDIDVERIKKAVK